ncbi:NUMOD4 motif-containing HNH endonuclease [Mycolicibacterium fortuitum]|uniref:NUMOD4 motif-containing HNH endonuclease n=1 Tax=Mycolicibacterium fortuitum TaxID=1766 RepID=UPI0037C90331
MEERWVPIPGLVGFYEVSDQGRVRSLDRIQQRRHGVSYPLKGRVLKPSKSGKPGKDYSSVGLCGPDSKVFRHVHRLVLETFVGPCPAGMEACHNNGDRFDNRLENLRWDTRSNNNLDKNKHGTNHQRNKTHCVHGHEFTTDNTIIRSGGRVCRACQAERGRREMREKLATPEGRADHAAYIRSWRRETGRVDGLGNQWARRTHCSKGHEFTTENTLSRSDGGRRCRTCAADADRERNRRRYEQLKNDPASRAKRNAYVRERRRSQKSS